jgi:hypothetical protein
LLRETAVSAFAFIVQNKLSEITLKWSAALVLWYCHLAKADGEKYNGKKLNPSCGGFVPH